MISLSIAEIASVVGGTVRNLDETLITQAIPLIDSRECEKSNGEFFFCAFKGEKIDGNNFAADAISHGAIFILTESVLDLPSITVPNLQGALTALARYVRPKMKARVVGITGSQGKTTTKDFLRAVLATSGSVIAPQGSYNNELGLPLTLLTATDETDYVVLEMGARHIGDISHLATIAKPDVGAVLVVGSAHIGEFGSQENLARAKGELIDGLDDGAIAVLGDYDEFTPHFGEMRKLRRIIFGEKSNDEIRAADIELRGGRAHFDLVAPDGRAPVSLKIVGGHHIANALAAAAIANALGIGVDQIASALSEAELTAKWRMELHEIAGRTIINDSYNANPESMAAALRTTSLITQETGGSSWAFLGKMHELGASEVERHLQIGRLASELHIDHLVEVSGAMYAPNGASEVGEMVISRASDMDDAMKFASFIAPGDCIVVKASRAEGLERLAAKLCEYFEAKQGDNDGSRDLSEAREEGSEGER